MFPIYTFEAGVPNATFHRPFFMEIILTIVIVTIVVVLGVGVVLYIMLKELPDDE
jgi:hypothetical protein